MRIPALIVPVALAAALAGCGGGDSPAAAATRSLDIQDFAFPKDVTVAKGTTVTWTNRDPAPSDHTVTAKTGATFDSKNIASGKSFSATLTETGTVTYLCSIHQYMTGSITVT